MNDATTLLRDAHQRGQEAERDLAEAACLIGDQAARLRHLDSAMSGLYVAQQYAAAARELLTPRDTDA